MTERFNKAMKALTQAFFNYTFMNSPVKEIAQGVKWAEVFTTVRSVPFSSTPEFVTQEWHPEKYVGETKEEIDATGYTWKELARIEYKYQKTVNYSLSTVNEILEDQYKGLCAVVEVLCEIEGLNSEEYKKYFKYTHSKEPVHEFVELN